MFAFYIPFAEPLRSYVRRPFQFLTETIRDHVPQSLNLHITGSSGSGASRLHSQASLLNFFTSRFFLLMFFWSIVMNRINAIVAPRNPHPLKLSVRFSLKIPAFYLLMKSVLVTTALLAPINTTFPLSWIAGLRSSFDEAHALWLSFIAMGVSCTIDSFIANLQNVGTNEQTINMLEWAIMYHFTPVGRDILIIALIQACQLLTLQFLSLSTRGKNYKLLVTTFWGMMDLGHFAHAIYYRSNTYPSLQLLARMPEVVVILMVGISMTLHALTYLVTGGNVRRQMFEPRAMPTMDEEYGLAIFKLGRACMEATRGVGFRNEIDAVVVPYGTMLDKKRTSKSASSSRSTTDSTRRGSSSSRHGSSSLGRLNSTYNPSGFANELPDVVETPGQRLQISRRRHKINVMRAFCQSGASLLAETAWGVYNRLVPARFRRAPRLSEVGGRMTLQELIQIRTTLENTLDKAMQARQRQLEEFEAQRYREAVQLDEEQEELIYRDFLSQNLANAYGDLDDDENDVDYRYPEDDEEDEESDGYFTEDSDGYEQATLNVEDTEHGDGFGLRRRLLADEDAIGSLDGSGSLVDVAQNENAETDSRHLGWETLGSMQDFLLDTSFMSIFLSGRLQDTPLTRSQYRQSMNGAEDLQELVESRAEDVSGRRSSVFGGGGHSRRSASTATDPSEARTLMAVLRKYRKSVSESGTASSVQMRSSDGQSSVAVPPLSAPSSSQDDSTIHSRLLCVVCQSEPRGVLLRPCRCLALCNECREVLASRRFKQCPCCRSDVQGFSKVYLP